MKFDPNHPHRGPGIFAMLRNNFFAGVVVIAPIGLTVWLIWTAMGWIDGFVLPFVPHQFNPEQYIGINLRGVGVIFFLLFTIVVGWIARGVIGVAFLRWAESLVSRMPIVRSIYNGVKQIAETVFAQQEQSFEKACLIQYPRPGTWVIGFVSTKTKGEVLRRTDAGPMMSVFVPTTPNPTSGFLLFLPEKDVTILDMTVEDAAKLVISAGLVHPEDVNGKPQPSETDTPVS